MAGFSFILSLPSSPFAMTNWFSSQRCNELQCEAIKDNFEGKLICWERGEKWKNNLCLLLWRGRAGTGCLSNDQTSKVRMKRRKIIVDSCKSENNFLLCERIISQLTHRVRDLCPKASMCVSSLLLMMCIIFLHKWCEWNENGSNGI